MTRPLLLPSTFVQQASPAPGAVAVVDQDHEFTYQHLAIEAALLADRLRAAGVGPGCLVGVLLPAGVELPTALLAVWQAGAGYLLLDPAQPVDRAAGLHLVLTTGELAAPAGATRTLCLDAPAEAALAEDAAVSTEPIEHAEAVAALCRTADGTLLTVDHADAARDALGRAERYGLSPRDRVLCTATPGRLAWEVFATLARGGTLVMAGTDPLAAVRAHRVTVLPLDAELAEQDPQEFAGVRLVAAADHLAQQQLIRWAEGSRAELWQSFGPQLCGVEVAAGRFDPAQPQGPSPVGRPELWVLDEYGDPVPPGVPGELHLGGLGTGCAVPGRPDATADLLLPDPDGEDGARLLRTGRLVRLRHDGTLEQLGLTDPSAQAQAAAPSAFERPAYVAPRTPEEAMVAAVWSELLAQDGIGADDNFFQLGGHSLLLTKLTERLRAATGRELQLTDVYGALTVADQARLVADPAAGLPPVLPVPRDEPLPLSFGQRRLWLLDSVKASPEWVIPLFLRLPSTVDTATARRSLDRLVERHESLRTRYLTVDGEPRQLVGAAAPVEWRELDAAATEREAVFRAQFEDGFALAAGRLLRALLVTEQDGERWLLVTIHHIACDGWSATLLEQEFQQLCAGGPELPALPVQYADYAAWQREARTPQQLAADLDFWRATLNGTASLELPTDYARPAERDPRGDLVPFTFSPELAEAVTALGRQRGATPFMILLTSFATLLARHTGQWDVPVGVPVAGRGRPELERVVGFFLNSLVLRCRLDPALGFTDALDLVRDTALDGFAHQDVPFERLVEELRPERDPSRTPLYQVALNFTDGPVNGGMPDTEHGEKFLYARQAAKTDLTLYVRTEADGSWTGALEYATALFARATVERLGAGLLQLVESVTAEPQGALGAAEILPAADRSEVLTRWNDTAEPWERTPVIDLIERQAAATPQATALVSGETRIDYRELDERANRIAHQLRALGAGPDTPVGVLLQRGPELLPALLGVWKAGSAYIPIDPANPAERIEHIVRDSGAAVLVTESALAPLAAAHQGARLLLDADRAAVDAQPSTAPARVLSPEHLAYVIYTSGSTGRPKGVMVTHAGLSNHLQWAARELVTTPGGAPLFSSIAFDLPATNLYAPLMTGQPVHLLPADLDLGSLGRTLAAAGPFSFIKLAAGHLELLAYQLSDEQINGLAQWVVVAGEALTPKVANRWQQALGGGRLINEYGPTENSIGSTIHPVTHPYTTTVPLGLPLPNTTGFILDAAGRPVPLGVTGELCLAGDGLARGYLGRPELTAEKFVPHPYGPPGSRLYRTGDLARRLPDGAIAFLGRMDDQVKLRGYRIELGEIETQLLAHPQVRAVAVVVRENQAGERALAAYLVPVDGAELDPAQLRTRLAGALPEYMVPSTFTVLDALPLTPNGKLDHRALPEAQSGADRYEAPATPTEERIAEIWCEVLGQERVSVLDGFFELGGHSILAIRMVAQLQEIFDLDIPIRTVFEFTTVRELAGAVEDLIRAEIDDLSATELDALTQEYSA
ncbi:amino acid adenylation domain-containing protein [Kitasatospora sp. MAP12-15]|uniref:non-ribosomal peptide synthetase n=1 Tax=unclassified Kitasatospora TaxID=2633591 RepID=UPI00247537B1|nr:non-ribosomal peptide synthetase [Kitasatospora sp. MAP12-44]MDH6113716.1 amino acid adenylation domain-containing protein [Kitasatospora sp. MAP12-44]